MTGNEMVVVERVKEEHVVLGYVPVNGRLDLGVRHAFHCRTITLERTERIHVVQVRSKEPNMETTE